MVYYQDDLLTVELRDLQMKGIPQGSMLSPILCNLYYGHAEKRVFGEKSNAANIGILDGRTLVLRLMDDYLIISIDE